MENKKEKKSIVDEMVSDLMKIYYRDYYEADVEPCNLNTERNLNTESDHLSEEEKEQKINEADQGKGIY